MRARDPPAARASLVSRALQALARLVSPACLPLRWGRRCASWESGFASSRRRFRFSCETLRSKRTRVVRAPGPPIAADRPCLGLPGRSLARCHPGPARSRSLDARAREWSPSPRRAARAHVYRWGAADALPMLCRRSAPLRSAGIAMRSDESSRRLDPSPPARPRPPPPAKTQVRPP